MMKYTAAEILSHYGTTRIDLGDYGLFDIEEVVVFPSDRAILRGNWESPAGVSTPAEVDLRMISRAGEVREPEDIGDVFGGFWEDWDLEPVGG